MSLQAMILNGVCAGCGAMDVKPDHAWDHPVGPGHTVPVERRWIDSRADHHPDCQGDCHNYGCPVAVPDERVEIEWESCGPIMLPIQKAETPPS